MKSFLLWESGFLVELQDGSKIFSLIADESRHCSNKEQMPIIIRFVNKNNEIQEIFLSFVEREQGTSGDLIASMIESTCQSGVGLA